MSQRQTVDGKCCPVAQGSWCSRSSLSSVRPSAIVSSLSDKSSDIYPKNTRKPQKICCGNKWHKLLRAAFSSCSSWYRGTSPPTLSEDRNCALRRDLRWPHQNEMAMAAGSVKVGHKTPFKRKKTGMLSLLSPCPTLRLANDAFSHGTVKIIVHHRSVCLVDHETFTPIFQNLVTCTLTKESANTNQNIRKY